MDTKIVTQPCKVDLHIHSAASCKTKDVGNKELAECTKDNIDTLVERLKANHVNICSITDHDCFDLDLYKTFKSKEGINSLNKVLPGIEFSVSFKGEGEKSTDTVIHIVAIFDDREPAKLEKLPSIICDCNGNPKYDNKNNDAFTEKQFTDLLRESGLNAILIGHEKSAGLEAKRDISSLGADKADEVILTEFIDAVEIKNRRKELKIKKLIDTYSKDKVPFVLGSDCHDWKVYPLKDKSFEKRTDEVAFSNIKCLPSFEGLLMAITEPSRIKVGETAFFNSGATKLESLNIHIDDTSYQIPLSPGINAIIGDNSIGKSMLIHALTSFRHLSDDPKLKQGYKDYCEREKLSINSSITDPMEFQFDDQGNVKHTLENLHANTESNNYFRKFFQKHVDVNGVRASVSRFLSEAIEALKSKANYNDAIAKLKISEIELKAISKSDVLSLTGRKAAKSFTDIDDFISRVSQEIAAIEGIQADHSTLIRSLGTPANESFSKVLTELNKLLASAKAYRLSLEIENMKIQALTAAVKNERQKLNQRKTDEQRISEVYDELLSNTAQMLAEAVLLKAKRKNTALEFSTSQPMRQVNRMGEFIFVSEVDPDVSKSDYCKTKITDVFNKAKGPSIIKAIESETTMTTSDIADAISNTKAIPNNCFDEIKIKLDNAINEIHESLKITNDKIGIESEPSPGLYGRLYFELLAEDDTDFGIYIIDQPEDQISQVAIKERVLDAFKNMSFNRQVLMITHNPQFVVNLDVDNVIAFERNEETERITIKSGALEYECNEYRILDTVANTVEGGADVVRKRLKRYGSKEY